MESEEKSQEISQKLVFLIGMPLSGKSSIGKLIAEMMGFRFVDLDEEISRSELKSIPAIFKEEGEEAFRNIEQKQLRKQLHTKETIVSCGGGTPCYADNLQKMKEAGLVVYLNTPLVILQFRFAQLVKNGRPLLKNFKTLEQLYIKRKTIYEAADLVYVNKAGLSEDAKKLVKSIEPLLNKGI